MEKPRGLLGLARELRDLIYDVLAEEEDFTELMHTCSQLRKEILSRMPGGELIDFTRAHSDEDLRQQTHNSIQTKTTNLIAEPWDLVSSLDEPEDHIRPLNIYFRGGWLNWSSREILDAWRVLTDWEYSVGLSYMRPPNSGHIRILELNRPRARNAISRALLYSLREEIDAIHAQYDAATGDELPQPSWKQRFGGAAGPDEKGPTRALIIASAVDSCFCSGADLKERKTFTQEETAAFLTTLRASLTSLSALPIPTISAIGSIALGGGLEFALATHFRVMSSNAVVGLPETRLGIIPGAGGTYRLPALIGVARARDIILTGRRVSAAEAYFLGIADRLVEVIPEGQEEAAEGEPPKVDAEKLLFQARRDVLSESVNLAAGICEGGPVAVRAALQAVQRPIEESENMMYERVVATEDRNEALKAFQEKRKPVFKGR
ncbi:putative methylglutaconyl- hydratase protein [Phaeoacremonium minimum UCRPA7]|uniref:Putative methylglutaconyl-hydratase protein n=1 Tax=Phaeoacremonium minimum (strain UCR-PA7) TaxID=1286976 RepID=R8B8K8_PHAM7|nr:putative methylglutaconyl- hydratase protein [Phaeoacremonium minimum UCRPA7]EON95607.1 putative methylglutaconyl- hydratase protein [Phaeoacremonium minimum UCRPA7]